MRIVLKNGKQRQLIKEAIIHAEGIENLSKNLFVSKSTIKKYTYSKILISEKNLNKIISLYPKIGAYRSDILEFRPDSWGQIKGGKMTYDLITKKYGKEEIKKRQINGGKHSAAKRESIQSKLRFNLKSEEFLEFYGALIGDGWISVLKNKQNNKVYWLIGLSGHISKDKDYLLRIREIFKKLFNRYGYMREKKKYNCVELVFGHKYLIKILNENLGFPIGYKKDIKIDTSLIKNWNTTKYIIRGIFDTDGSLFFDRDTRYKNPYPILDITTVSKPLLDQISYNLKANGFNVITYKKGIRIKGKYQLIKWFNEIEPKNKKHILKYQWFIANYMDP